MTDEGIPELAQAFLDGRLRADQLTTREKTLVLKYIMATKKEEIDMKRVIKGVTVGMYKNEGRKALRKVTGFFRKEKIAEVQQQEGASQ